MSQKELQHRCINDFQDELDLLDSRYRIEKIIGSGSYGVVLRAKDNLDGGVNVAIKRVNKEIFEEAILAKRILREVKLLAHFNDDNIIRLRNILTPPTEDFNSFYIVMDIMETDLKQVIKSGQSLSDAHIQFFIYQALRALRVIHSAGVIHRDITPANILVNTNCDLKICDFGLAKEESDDGTDMTDYVTMRWYRAPELVMEHKNYTTQIDVWGIGCVMGELLGSKPLCPGKDRVNQLDRIIDLVGTPSEAVLSTIGSKSAQKYLREKGNQPPLDLATKYPKAHPAALDLLQRMLAFHPDTRVTVQEAMKHPFLSQLYDEADENSSVALFEFDESPKSISDIKKAIYQASVDFHQQHPTTAPRSGYPKVALETSGAVGRGPEGTLEKMEHDKGDFPTEVIEEQK